MAPLGKEVVVWLPSLWLTGALFGASGGAGEVLRASFGAEVSEVAAARRFVADSVARWGSVDDRDTAVLLASELVTNAVVHAASDVEITVRVAGSRMTVEVHDESEVVPGPRDVEEASVTGRGVAIVAALADDWGVASLPGDGKVVWFALTPGRS